ncbi:MAG: hypothetical protein M1831_003267 [Alyxoria varia]|nr:MAG: hypothetical protein M1831_003267 [Alyxoria varia]
MATAPKLPPPRPYRDFLTPVLHRRFWHACLVAFGVANVGAIWMSDFEISWSWFPICYLRSILLFIPALGVFILRVAQLHIAPRKGPSPAHTFVSQLCSYKTLHTLAWYAFSAWFFCEVYIWSAPSKANLAIVDPGKPYERPRLNERPIYLRSMFFLLSLSQTAFHLIEDYDLLPFPIQKTGKVKPLIAQLQQPLLRAAQRAVIRMVVMAFLGPLIYALFLRQTAWSWAYTVTKNFFSLSRSTRPPQYAPFLGDLIGRFFAEGALLVFLWEATNAAFGVFFIQEPLKKEAPLTTDSANPNGSLISGLKSKKEATNCSALWELTLIAYRFPARRETIYKEIEDKNGSTWSQTLPHLLRECQAIKQRIQDYQNPPAHHEDGSQGGDKANGDIGLPHLPKISAPLNDANILQAPPAPKNNYEAVASQVDSFAKSRGLSPSGKSLRSSRAESLLARGADALMSKDQQENISRSAMAHQVYTYALAVLQSPIGRPFRVTFARRAELIVMGDRAASAVVDAVSSLAKLAVCSLKEDSYGRVHRDVARIIRTYAETIQMIEYFVSKGLDVHWTDVEMLNAGSTEETTNGTAVNGGGRSTTAVRQNAAKKPQRSGGKEVEAVVAALKSGLKDLLNEFGEFREEIGLSSAEWRRAKELLVSGRPTGVGPS